MRVKVLKLIFAEKRNKKIIKVKIIKVKIILHYGVEEEFILLKILWLHTNMHICLKWVRVSLQENMFSYFAWSLLEDV